MLATRDALQLFLVSLPLAALGSAQYTPDATITSSIPSYTPSVGQPLQHAIHTIQVGPKTNPHAYVPNSITAAVGDIIVFEFWPTNHSVVKADYLAPCVPASEDLFYSGPFTTFHEENDQLVLPRWSITINDTQPTFFYCTAIGSCLDNGMVGVINPNSTETFQAQYKRALTYPYMLVPGQPMPAEGSTGPTAPTTTSASATTAAAASSGDNSLSNGAIAGIVVACVAFVAILVALFFLLGRNRVYRQWMSSEDGRTARTAHWAIFNSQGGDAWNGKSELDSNATKAPPTEIASASSPGTQYRTFSPQVGGHSPSAYGHSSPHQSGNLSWDARQNAWVYSGPNELEAHSVEPQIAEMSDVREYR